MQNKKALEKNNGEYRECRIPGIVCTNKGTLIAYYECRKESSDWAEIDLKIICSIDQGDNWQTVGLIQGEGSTLNNPVMIVLDEIIIFIYCKNYKKIFMRKSYDDGLNFTDEIEITTAVDNVGFFYNALAIGPGHGIVHKDNIIIPIWFAYNKENAQEHRPSVIGTIFSKDKGNTWNIGDIIGKDELVNPSECALGITGDDQVIISIRNENSVHRRAIAFSDTGYDKWTNVIFEESLPDPVCQGSIDSFDNKLFHINCVSEDSRKNLCVKITEDCFKSYKRILIDDEGGIQILQFLKIVYM